MDDAVDDAVADAGGPSGRWVLGAGAIGAAAFPGFHPGIGWFVAGVVVAVGVLVARRRRAGNALSAAPDRAWRIAAGIAALALLAVPAVRAAPWLGVVCVLTAVGLGSYSLTGGRTWAEIGLGSVAVTRGVPPGVVAVARSTAHGGVGRGWRVISATGVGVVLVLLFGTLFRAADPDFDRLVGGWTGVVSGGTAVRLLCGFVLVGTVAAGAAYVVDFGVHYGQTEEKDEPARLRTAEWAVPLSMLVALFAAFVSTQLSTLFGGREHVMDPAGPDFADYARDGFVLLSAVTVLTLGIVAALARFAGRAVGRDRVLLRVLGGALCALTLVIVASALNRMNLYVDAYGLSPQRLLGYAVEVWLGLLFVLVLAAGWRLRARWLPRAVTAAAVLVLISVAAVNPEALMARTHIDRLERGYPLDTAFLNRLSADAATELIKVPPVWRWCDHAFEPAPPDPWYRFNLSRHRARTLDYEMLC